MPVSSTLSSSYLSDLILCLGIDVSLRSVTQAKRLSRNAITWKRTSIDQVLSSPVTSSPGTFDLVHMSPITTKSNKSLSISTDMEKESWYGSTMSPIDRCVSPESMYCTGKCRDDPSPVGRISADVVGVPSTFVSFQANLWSFASKSRFPCLRQRIVSDRGKIHKDRL
jgi:hypothetical protein